MKLFNVYANKLSLSLSGFWYEVLGWGFRLRFRVEVSSWGLWLRFGVRSCDKDHAIIQVYCCNLSVDVALNNVQFTTMGMCTKNNTHILVCGTNKQWVISSGDKSLLLLAAEVWSVATWAFRSQQNGAVTTPWDDDDVKAMPDAAFTKRMCDRCGLLQKGRDVFATSQLTLRWMCDSPWTGCVRRNKPIYI